MTAMRKIWATRVNNATAATFVGHKGTIFFDELTGALRISDGTTVGGQPLTLVASDFQFAFGDFVATTPGGGSATLMSVNDDQNIDIASNGTGVINVIGNFHVHQSSTYDPEVPDVDSAVLTVTTDGLTKFHTSAPPLGTAVVSISSNASDTVIPLAAGAMGAVLQLTGADNASTTVGMDTFANNATASSNFTFRRYRGTPDAPLAVQSGDLIAALGATGFDGTGTATLPGQVTSIRFVAAENQTLTNKGSRIDMYAIPLNTSTRTLNLSLDGVKVSVPLDTQSTSTTTGALVTAGGLGVVKDAYIGGAVHAGSLYGKLYRTVRDAGTIGDGGTLTIDLSSDAIVHCMWGNGMTIAYTNFVAGRVVKIMATKSAGSGTDNIDLDGVTAAQVSSGGTTITANAGATTFIEVISTTSAVGGIYIKL